MIDIDEMEKAIEEARLTIKRADWTVAKMLNICRGRLKNANAASSVLNDLKRELKAWDMNRKKWNKY